MKITLMRKIIIAIATTGILMAIVAEPLAAEPPFDRSEYPYCCRGDRSDWLRRRYSQSYDSEDIEIEGEVVSVENNLSRRGSFQGVHLLVKTNKETVEVHLGPSWYLENRDFKVAPKDQIAILGSRINFDGEAIIARQITKGENTLILRDRNGYPLWRGWRR